ncbi:MAG: MoaD/ThiS family protein [Candidatus Aerophobetes bacterium]|nr:MoaD/ThiS family protein [Candidatus Aerophobetes bacterium]
MKVKVKFFASQRKAVGKSELEINSEEKITINRLLEMLITEYPELKKLAKFTIVSLNYNFANGSELLKDGDEVALFPPVGGG